MVVVKTTGRLKGVASRGACFLRGVCKICNRSPTKALAHTSIRAFLVCCTQYRAWGLLFWNICISLGDTWDLGCVVMSRKLCQTAHRRFNFFRWSRIRADDWRLGALVTVLTLKFALPRNELNTTAWLATSYRNMIPMIFVPPHITRRRAGSPARNLYRSVF